MFRYLSEVFVTDESFSGKGGGTTAACPDGIICIAVLIIIDCLTSQEAPATSSLTVPLTELVEIFIRNIYHKQKIDKVLQSSFYTPC